MAKKKKKQRRKDEDIFEEELENEFEDEDEEFDDDDDVDGPTDGDRRDADEAESSRREKSSKLSEMRKNLGVGPNRPGEQEVLKSPLVLSLIGGCAVLVILGGVFWFMMAREQAQLLFDAAKTDMDGGKFKQAIEGFDNFLNEYPKHKDLSDPARLERGKCMILEQISGSKPDWERGQDALHNYTRTFRDTTGYAEQKDSLARYAEKIAKGAATDAGKPPFEKALLGTSDAAKQKLQSLASKEKPPTLALAAITEARAKSLAAIDKNDVYVAGLAEIDGHLKAAKPISAMEAHRRLLQRYPDLEKDKKLRQFVAQMMGDERKLVQLVEGAARPGQAEQPASNLPPSITMALRTRAQTAIEDNGQRVFALSKDCIYGVATLTGDAVWRHVIGLDTPFFPQVVNSATPGLLAFNTQFGELQLVSQSDGKLIWRQPMQHMATGLPLIHQGQIYLTAQGGHLYRINLEDGAVSAQMKFSQDLVPRPALSHDSNNLLVLGGYGVIYTLSLRPFECKTVTFIGHSRGGVNVPMTPMGTLLLVVENHAATEAKLRVIQAGEDGEAPAQTGEAAIPGFVRDAPILRGDKLYVPSGGNRITAYTVTDESDDHQMTQIDVQQLEIDHKGPVHLLAGPNGRLWMSSEALDKFDMSADRLAHDTNRTAFGMTTQPIQTANRKLFVGRRTPYCDAVFFTQNDGNTLTGAWRTTLGSRVLQVIASPPAYAIAVSETGEIFRLNSAEIARGGFKFDAQSLLELPKDLVDPVRATLLSDGRIVAYCGNPEPMMWFINGQGQKVKTERLEKRVVLPPVLLKAGILIPMEDRIIVSGGFFTGGAKTEPFRAPLGVEGFAWVSVEPIDDTSVIVVTNQKKLHKVQYRMNPPGLQGIADITLDAAIDFRIQIHNGRILFADSAGNLKMLDAASLDEVGPAIKLATPVSNDLWMVGDRLFVETRGGKLHSFSIGSALKEEWSTDLNGAGLAGGPLLLRNGSLVFAQQNGEIWATDADGQAVGQRLSLRQQLAGGPKLVGSWVFVDSMDGTLHRVESVLQAAATVSSGPSAAP
ncbi:MAG: PQQ-binding-like beta-propeller repeat protein [Planctomycetota bacterium]|nr:PQQ-binding-like beta-propeller repeat protein [Planctomycetota bacterium]